MKIPKELDEKLRVLMVNADICMQYCFSEVEGRQKQGDITTGLSPLNMAAVKGKIALVEIKRMLDAPIEGKYKQLDIEEEVNKVKKNENY